MEEGAINNPSTSHPQRASSGESTNQQIPSSFPSFPTHLDQGASFIQQEIANAGDASLEALWPLFVKIQPSLSSLLQDLANWDAPRLLPAPKFDEAQENSSSQDELEQIVSEVPSSRRERIIDENRAQCGPLLHAAIKGDWPAAKAFLEKYPHCVRPNVSKEEGTALHEAVVAQQSTFIKELLKLMTPEDLELRTKQGATALHFAAQSGIVRIAEQLVKINNKPLLIDDCDERTPLQYAVELGRHRNMVSYLFSVTPLIQLTAHQRSELLLYAVSSDFYDIALKILEMDPNIANADSECGPTALSMLAKKTFAIGSTSQLSFWKSRINSSGQLPSSDRLSIVSGAALQMQRELLWFKEIEKIVPPSYLNQKNSNGQTPKEIFIEAHTDLQKDGETWMKDTSNYSMLVATLIATVIFAAAFTVPGGNNQETGTPIFLRSTWFMA
ncbi:ankyrin repeat-containing protein ITN1-like [Corylus avellana]|uniref:ankyrin repeat-containing protein ITN1-like n=1 Tax=Corylus avellana TaxID=13451 RepID=UPI00286C4FFB|nr:ankyrin repeat-containing protein ITN1-like [Corylus avellana]